MRVPAVAGMFYPDEGIKLLGMIKELLGQCKKASIKGRLRGLIVPHAGYIFSGIVAAAGYNMVLSRKEEIDKIILIGPSHYMMFNGAASSGEDVWETPLGMVEVHELIGRHIVPFPRAHVEEHSLEVQVPFLQVVCPSARIYPLVTGEVDPSMLAKDIEQYIDDRTLILVSSDLSHYYPYYKAVEIDSKANECIPSLNIECVNEKVEACGKTGILTLMHIAKDMGWKGQLIDYKNSGDTYKDKSQVVGYGCYAFFE
ncbi:MAG: AmmeMemoRadiSam system protein B [Candidatus Micrarchaeia archaeon]